MTTQPSQTRKRVGPLVVAICALVLLILHQDYWFWTNKTLVFGALPIGLCWHMGISIAATFIWYLATQIAWPLDTLPLDTLPLDTLPLDTLPLDTLPLDTPDRFDTGSKEG